MTTEAKESDVKAALLMKTAIRTNGGLESACIVTASEEGVFFANAVNLTSGLKLTIEEWNRVVEFVDREVLQGSDKACGDWVGDWSKVPASINYVAKDPSGLVWGNPEKMTWREYENGNEWLADNEDHESLPHLNKSAERIPAEKSLVKRPGV